MKRMDEKRYYFITFWYGASEKTMENGVIDVHPLEWQNKRPRDQYVLNGWQEIYEDEYMRANWEDCRV